MIESHHAPGFAMPMTEYDFFKVVYVLAGRGWLYTDEGRFALTPHALLIVPENILHRFEDHPSEPLALVLLCADRHFMKRLPTALVPRAAFLQSRQLAHEARDILRRLLAEQSLDTPATPLMMTGLATQLFALLQRHRSISPPPHRTPAQARMAEYVRDLDHSFHRTQNLNTAAQTMGMSRRYFSQLFRQYTGTSWLRYLRARRLQHAEWLLANTDRTAITVAFECGFEELSTFYRAFKSATGQSPVSWRASHSRQ